MLVLKSVALLRPCRLKVRPLDSLSGNTSSILVWDTNSKLFQSSTMVVQRIVNPSVAGSIPAFGASLFSLSEMVANKSRSMRTYSNSRLKYGYVRSQLKPASPHDQMP